MPALEHWPPLLSAFIVANLLWRFVAFWWSPLDVGEFPGVLIEASALAGTALLVAWLVLGDQLLIGRVWLVGPLYLAARLLQDLGLIVNAVGRSAGDAASNIGDLRLVEDEVLFLSLMLSLGLRFVAGWHISGDERIEIVPFPPRQFHLRQVFAATAAVAIFFGATKINWIGWIFGDERASGLLLFYAFMIAITVVPAFPIWLANCRWWGLVGLLIYWFSLPILLYYFMLYIGYLKDPWISSFVILHAATVVAGPAVIVLLTALVCRRCGIRLRYAKVTPRRSWPTQLPWSLEELKS